MAVKAVKTENPQMGLVKPSKEQLNQQFVNDYAMFQTQKCLRQKALGEAKAALQEMKEIQARLDANCPDLATGKSYDDLQMALPFAAESDNAPDEEDGDE